MAVFINLATTAELAQTASVEANKHGPKKTEKHINLRDEISSAIIVDVALPDRKTLKPVMFSTISKGSGGCNLFVNWAPIAEDAK